LSAFIVVDMSASMCMACVLVRGAAPVRSLRRSETASPEQDLPTLVLLSTHPPDSTVVKMERFGRPHAGRLIGGTRVASPKRLEAIGAPRFQVEHWQPLGIDCRCDLMGLPRRADSDLDARRIFWNLRDRRRTRSRANRPVSKRAALRRWPLDPCLRGIASVPFPIPRLPGAVAGSAHFSRVRGRLR
jgi:hypothetical protein